MYLQTEKALELLVKFENISGPNLELREKYQKVLANYGKDLETVRKLYQKQKNEPIIPRNLPPISGKISWARQLYRKIEGPMKIFRRKPDVLKVSLEYFRCGTSKNIYLGKMFYPIEIQNVFIILGVSIQYSESGQKAVFL